MSEAPAGSPGALPRPGEVLLAGVRLLAVELDVASGCAWLRCEGGGLELERVHATNLLSPWDGAPGQLEHVKVLEIEAGLAALEVRVRYATVPRVYRVVCGGVRRR